MAREVQVGRARVHGIRNDGAAITMTGYASFTLDTVKLTRQYDAEFLKDELGFDKTGIATNAHDEMDVSFEPDEATRVAAEAEVVFLAPLAKITFTHFAVPICNGDSLVLSGQSIDLSMKSAKMTLKTRRYADSDQNASMVETVA